VKKRLVLSGLFLFLFASVALAQNESTLYYQKKLAKALTKSHKITTVNVTFSLWSAAAGGYELWSETKGISANKSTRLITTNLGDTNQLTENDFGPQMWVQVEANGKVIGNRDPLEGAPYALSMENILMDGADNTAIGINAFNTNTTGTANTASGFQALYSNTTGWENTASGYNALFRNTTGYQNTASGSSALFSSSIGLWNTADGAGALQSNTTGSSNTASGYDALQANTTGSQNTASGSSALFSNTTGSSNTALGFLAGYYSNGAFTGSNNIYIGENVSPAAAGESNVIRIGNNQTATYIAGISGHGGGGNAVYVASNGQLGTVASSRRYKDDIEDMGDASSGLMKLRPVAFHYKPEYANGPRTLQYGLIAEDVAEVYPDLVQYDPKTGQPQTVYYHLVNAMLLNEVQKQQREISALKEQNKEISAQVGELSALKEQVGKLSAQAGELSALKEQVKELSALVEQNKESTRLSKLEAQLNK
jgi:hypothetical protein